LMSPAAAKSTAAEASAAARATGRLRRFLANSCRPTESTLRRNNEIINMSFVNLTGYPRLGVPDHASAAGC
jgi:hypothetical protein